MPVPIDFVPSARLEAVALYRQLGLTYEQIGVRLSISRQTAHCLFRTYELKRDRALHMQKLNDFDIARLAGLLVGVKDCEIRGIP